MRYVALLRGINVGGNNKVAMADLRALLSSLGYTDVSTYIQSGNAVFTSPQVDAAVLEAEIAGRIEQDLGVKIAVMVRNRDELASVIEANPFLKVAADRKELHAAFLAEQIDAERLAEVDATQYAPDEFRVGDRVLYLRTPNGLGKTNLSPQFWKTHVRVSATTRNWNTVTKLLSLLDT